jgi:Ca2+-binding RTX toxin-like protein
VTVIGIDRLLVKLGSGNDVLSVQTGGSHEIWSGAGNDQISINNGSVYAGDGDDVIVNGSGLVDAGAGNDIIRGVTGGFIDGGSGYDELVADLSVHQGWATRRNLTYWRLDSTGSGTNYVGAGSSWADIEAYLAIGGKTYLGSQYGELLLSYSGIEKISLTGLNRDVYDSWGYGDDLLIAVGQGGKYAGGDGTDTLYADWSNNTVSATIDTSDPTQEIAVNGGSISGIDRLLVKLGSGNDVLSVQTGGSHEIWSGAGNDQISINNGSVYAGDGDDVIVNGSGLVDAGAGNDIIRGVTGGFIDGGSGYDELVADLSVHQGWATRRNLTYWRLDSTGSGTNYVGAGSSWADIEAYLAIGGKTYLGSQYGELLLSYSGIEKISLTGLNRDIYDSWGYGDDLLIAVGQGGKYAGGDGTDTLYADWSSNTVSATIDTSDPTQEIAVNGGSISGIDRLLVKLGSGNDVLSVQTGGSHEIWSGAGNDQISINNGSVYAGDGDDVIAGGISSDYLDAGADNDTLNGGAGADTLIGGTGDDLYIVDDINDIIIENTDAGTDTVQSLISYTLTDNTENLVLTGTDALNGTGNSLNNTLMGNNGNNYLLGGFGDDTLIANNGDDSLEGEAGNDLLIGGSGTDTYLFNRNAGATGQDTIDDTDGLSTITITGTTLAQLTATQQANDLILAIQNSTDTITVKNFFDSNNLASYQLNLDGGVVLDKTALLQLLPKITVVEGTTGSDVLQGGTENDTYIVNNARDFIKEPTGNSSIDTVQASVSYALLPSLENLTLTGAANLSGTGNSADNIIKGNEGKNRLLAGDGNDTLNGGAGSDTLNGGNGADVMYGGTGNDTFTVQDVADMVIEFANEGYDSVNSFITYTLTANVERLNLENAGGQIDGFGNELDNSLNGNNLPIIR